MRRVTITALGVTLLGLLFGLASRRLRAADDSGTSPARAAESHTTTAESDRGTQARYPSPPDTRLPDVLVDPRVHVEKAERVLTVYSEGMPVKTYRIAMGRAPVGDKSREGDQRTPEGSFYVCTKNPESRHRRSLGLSYPAEQHADKGLEQGLITKRQHRTIIDALERYERPPWSTPLGGEIMIHGGGTGSDWTQGCIAVEDDEAEELYNALPMGTPVDIVP
jgi:lipoprotein-anchoring transpeptidase ErfK/SrfK